jgi:hypothetical protein
MITRRGIVKLVAIGVIILVGIVYWYYAEKRSSPIEEVQKSVQQ